MTIHLSFLRFAHLPLALACVCGALPGDAALVKYRKLHSPKASQLYHFNEGIGSFTPAAADPKLANALVRSGMMDAGFRLTPASNTIHVSKSVTLALRSQTSNERAVASAINPQALAYNLGVAVGWRKFALTGDYSKTDLGLLQGQQQNANMGLSINLPRWSSRIAFGQSSGYSYDPNIGLTHKTTLDFGTGYRIGRNVNLTAGLRFNQEQDRLNQSLAEKRDSQAVYVGTQFKF
jgi:hypothetical protein